MLKTLINTRDIGKQLQHISIAAEMCTLLLNARIYEWRKLLFLIRMRHCSRQYLICI